MAVFSRLRGGLACGALGMACLATLPTTARADGQNMIGRQSQNEGLNVLPVPGAMTIDGDLADWDWSGRMWVFADTGVRTRYSVEAAAMWDAEYLYLGAIWKDPTPMFNMIDPAFNPNEGWKSDCWQIRILSDRIGHLTTWHFTGGEQPVMHVNYSPRGVGGETFVLAAETGGRDLGRGVQMAFRRHPDGAGYNQEMRIPWQMIFETVPAIEPGLALRLGFEFLWGDPTGRHWPQHRYADNMQPGVTSREFYWSNTRAWGDATLLAEGNLEPRSYVSTEGRLRGTVPIRFDLPLDGQRFTVVVETADGRRVRNLGGDLDPAEYTVKTNDATRTVEVLWDALDDNGKLVAPGTYATRGLSHGGIGAEYEQCFYNPGTPPWEVRAGTGAWGSDHNPPLNVAPGGDMVVISWGGAEGGSGIIGIGPDGLKKWGEKRGGRSIAADSAYVHAIASSTYAKGVLTRFDVKSGRPAPYMHDGQARPFELHMAQIFDGEEVGDALTLALHDGVLALALSTDRLALLDAESAMPRRLLEVPAARALAFAPDGTLYGIIADRVQRIDLDSGALAPLALPGLGQPVGLAFTAEGRLVVADAGVDSQVKIYDPAGKRVRDIGRRGGRPLRGRFDPQALMRISSVAVDHAGTIWVVENWNDPRRVSLWSADGERIRDYIGNTAYAGTGSYLHDEEPDLAYVGSVEMKLDRETRAYEVTRILWVPAPEASEAFPLWSHPHSFPNPKLLTSEAAGERRRYLYFNGMYSRYHAMYMHHDEAWRPVAALAHVKYLPEPIKANLFGDLNDKASLFWNDLDGDGRLSRDECIIVPEGLELGAGWGQMPGDDLSIYANGIVRYRPLRFMDDGAPVYGPDGMVEVGHADRGEVVPVDAEDLLLVMSRVGYPRRGPGIQGVDRSTGAVRWAYPDPYPGVHGSHRSPMPEPGMLIGTLRMMGVAWVDDTVGRVFALRGNLGQDYFMTTDGLFVGAMFQDGRLPAPSLPETEDMLVGMPMEMFSGGGEPFGGWFGRHRDGRIRLLTGFPRQAAMILEVRGLDSIRRFDGPNLSIDLPLLLQAEADNAARTVTDEAPKIYAIGRAQRKIAVNGDAADWEGVASMPLARRGSPDGGTARLAYDDTHLYAIFEINDRSPWRNEGRDFTRLFKTGDAVDLQFNVNPKTPADRREVAAGDVRLLIAPFGGKPTTVLMKPIEPDAPTEAGHVYSSPVQPRAFARVQVMAAAKVAVKLRAGAYTVEAAIPLAEIGLSPQAGISLRGDVGFISSDEQGMINVARTYWANRLTNLVNDEPSEAWLYPAQWGTWTFE